MAPAIGTNEAIGKMVVSVSTSSNGLWVSVKGCLTWTGLLGAHMGPYLESWWTDRARATVAGLSAWSSEIASGARSRPGYGSDMEEGQEPRPFLPLLPIHTPPMPSSTSQSPTTPDSLIPIDNVQPPPALIDAGKLGGTKPPVPAPMPRSRTRTSSSQSLASAAAAAIPRTPRLYDSAFDTYLPSTGGFGVKPPSPPSPLDDQTQATVQALLKADATQRARLSALEAALRMATEQGGFISATTTTTTNTTTGTTGRTGTPRSASSGSQRRTRKRSTPTSSTGRAVRPAEQWDPSHWPQSPSSSGSTGAEDPNGAVLAEITSLVEALTSKHASAMRAAKRREAEWAKRLDELGAAVAQQPKSWLSGLSVGAFWTAAVGLGIWALVGSAGSISSSQSAVDAASAEYGETDATSTAVIAAPGALHGGLGRRRRSSTVSTGVALLGSSPVASSSSSGPGAASAGSDGRDTASSWITNLALQRWMKVLLGSKD